MRPISPPVLVPNEEVLTACAAEMIRDVYRTLPELMGTRRRMLVIRPAPGPVSWFGVAPTTRDGHYRLVELREHGLQVREDLVLERRVVTVLAREYRDYTMRIDVNLVDCESVADRFDAETILLADGVGPSSPTSGHDPPERSR